MTRVRMRLPTLVAWSCDRIGAATARTAEREPYTRLVLAGVPPGAPLLGLGCGAGEPTTRRFVHRCDVTGVDVVSLPVAAVGRAASGELVAGRLAPHLPVWRRSPGAERDVAAEGRQRAV